jgi:DNA-binding XRE family transcriptional regulator
MLDPYPRKKPSPLAAARRAAGLTQVQLAARVGIHPQTLAVAERGALSETLAARIAKALGCAVRDIAPQGQS